MVERLERATFKNFSHSCRTTLRFEQLVSFRYHQHCCYSFIFFLEWWLQSAPKLCIRYRCMCWVNENGVCTSSRWSPRGNLENLYCALLCIDLAVATHVPSIARWSDLGRSYEQARRERGRSTTFHRLCLQCYWQNLRALFQTWWKTYFSKCWFMANMVGVFTGTRRRRGRADCARQINQASKSWKSICSWSKQCKYSSNNESADKYPGHKHSGTVQSFF